jgi:hypothetical protein
MIEQAETAAVTGATILRAMRAYSCLTKNGDWVELPKQRIVRRSQRKSPAAVVANRNAATKKSSKSLKTNA